MSLRSMTGYGHASARENELIVAVEIGSVNRKQLDIVCAFPRGLQMLEARIVETLQPQVSRGRISITITVDWSTKARQSTVAFNEPLAQAYVHTLRQAAARLGVDPALDMGLIAGLPDVLKRTPPEEDAERVWRVLERALKKAVTTWNAMRRREGKALQTDLQNRLNVLEREMQAIQRIAPNVTVRYRQRLRDRLAEAGLAWSNADERLIKEIALFADRADISEELTRLNSHLKQARQMTRSTTATGRSLDFLAQELLREINTIGSKANDSDILQHVVAFKTELERYREQVQNVE